MDSYFEMSEKAHCTTTLPQLHDQTLGSFIFTLTATMILVFSVCVWLGKAFEALEEEANSQKAGSQPSPYLLSPSSPKVNENSILPPPFLGTEAGASLMDTVKVFQDTVKPKTDTKQAPQNAKSTDSTSIVNSAKNSDPTNDAVREQFGKLCKLLETPGWWIVKLIKGELIARPCRPHHKLQQGEFKLRAKKIGEVPSFGHFNKLAPAQADLMNVYRQEIERLFDDPIIQKSIGPSRDEILTQIRKCTEMARQEKLRRELNAELDALPDFNDLLQEMKRDMETD